jgi:LPS O-antigen subunit length determinant protein (WzzB/FepE family)
MVNPGSENPEKGVKRENEIDLLQLVITIWGKRRTIIKATIICMCIGLLIALLSAREYTATTIMVPQTGDNKSQLSGLSSIAALAGFNMNLVTTG